MNGPWAFEPVSWSERWLVGPPWKEAPKGIVETSQAPRICSRAGTLAGLAGDGLRSAAMRLWNPGREVLVLSAALQMGCGSDFGYPSVEAAELRDANGEVIAHNKVSWVDDKTKFNTKLPVDGSIAVVFDQEVDLRSAEDAIDLEIDDEDLVDVHVSKDGRRIIVEPEDELEASASYVLYVDAGVEDLDGLGTDDDIEIAFETE